MNLVPTPRATRRTLRQQITRALWLGFGTWSWVAATLGIREVLQHALWATLDW